MATFDEVPEYLKSLEEMLSKADSSATVSATATEQPTPQQYETAQPLSSIGFGSMFTTASAGAEAHGAEAHVKFMLVSTHVHQYTGYSKVSYGILSELARHPWIQLTHFAFQKQTEVPAGFRPYPPNVDVVDAMALEKPLQQGFGIQALPDVIRRKRPNVVMIYNDLSVVARFLEEIRKSGIQRNFQIWVYCDQVYTMQPQILLDVLNRDADRIFAFTPYWKQMLKDQGVTRPIDVLLHGFQPNVYFPMPKELARKQLQLPSDIFLFLNLNRNQPRKRYDILIMAFVELVVKYPTKPIFLLAVCDKGDKGGWWLFELFQRELRLREVSLELYGSRLIVTTQNLAFKDEEINLFYNAADVGISTADGEGFGLCQFENMGVGVPQVVPDIGGFKEFCDPTNASLVKPTVRYYVPNGFSPVGGEAHACDPHNVCVAMEEYLLNSDKRAEHGKSARAKVLSYTWKNSCEILLKRLKDTLESE
jgi:glycosyltransferase involved in cell wall biosynthesis